MSSLVVDLAIYVLLAITIGFSGIGIIGLFLFPDIRSRRFTAFRASLIGIVGLGTAVILYGLYQFLASSRSPYLTLVLHTLILLGIIIGANMLVSREILDRAIPQNSCETEPKKGQKKPGKK